MTPNDTCCPPLYTALHSSTQLYTALHSSLQYVHVVEVNPWNSMVRI